MTEVNPLAVAILSSTQTQRQLAADKGRLLRRAPVPQKDSSGESKELDHQIDSPDIVTLIGDDARERGEPERHPSHPRPEEEDVTAPSDDGLPHIDITG